jgi:GT2 family glycosyltransferase
MSGGFLANGASTGEISRSEAARMVQLCSEPGGDVQQRAHLPGGLMTVRRKVAQKVRFDERLRLYGLYEDYDFSVRCVKFGLLMNVPSCQMVHLATQTSRVSAKRFGYSCVMNGFYLCRKGSQTMWDFLRTTIKTIFANVLGIVVVRHGTNRAERCERLYGIALGFRDVLLHGAEPELVEYI